MAALAGLVGSAAVTGATAAAHTLAPAVRFLPYALAQSLIRAAPGGLATYFIEHLGHWAMRLAVAGTAAAFIGSGAVLGLLIPPLRRVFAMPTRVATVVAFLPMWGVSVALYPAPDSTSLGRWPFALVSLPIYALGGLVAGWAFLRLHAVREASPRLATDLSRRYFLRALWWAALSVLFGAASLGRLLYRRPDPGLQLLRLRDVEPASTPSPSPSDAEFDGVSGLEPEVTSNDLFYVVDEEIIDPDIDPMTWRLAVGGLVRRPLSLTYDQLKGFPAVERYQTLQCISNDVGGHLISTAKWAGVPLRLVLDRAGVLAGAVEVVFRAAGGYSDSLSIDQAMDESTLVAIGMNDHVLPRAHGFPARILSVGTYGMKNPKWLMGVDVVDRPYEGYWEQRGWSKAAIVKTESRIDTPRGTTVHGPGLAIAGIAFAGDRGISKVEVSTDGGRSWNTTRLRTPLSPYTWRQWLYRWAPRTKGQAGLVVRAYDGRGAVQTSRYARPHPDGASGYDATTVDVGS